MAAPFLPQDALKKLRTVARAKGLHVWVDHQARITGKPFVLLQRMGTPWPNSTTTNPRCSGWGASMTAAINRALLALWCAAPSRWFRKGAAHDDTKGKAPHRPRRKGLTVNNFRFCRPRHFAPHGQSVEPWQTVR